MCMHDIYMIWNMILDPVKYIRTHIHIIHIWKWYFMLYVFNNCKEMINDVVGIHVEIWCVCTSNYNIWRCVLLNNGKPTTLLIPLCIYLLFSDSFSGTLYYYMLTLFLISPQYPVIYMRPECCWVGILFAKNLFIAYLLLSFYFITMPQLDKLTRTLTPRSLDCWCYFKSFS